MTSSAHKRYTVDEYLALEASSEVRHEYFDGEIFAMAGGTATHSLTKVNCASELRLALKGSGCLVFDSDMNVRCPSGLRTYPDLSVTCSKPEYEDERELALLNPQLVVEVLSETTEAYDRGRKFDNYKTIPTLDAYVLLASDRAHADHFARSDEGRWVLTSYDGLDAVVELPGLGVEVALAEVYTNVEFPVSDAGATGEAP